MNTHILNYVHKFFLHEFAFTSFSQEIQQRITEALKYIFLKKEEIGKQTGRRK